MKKIALSVSITLLALGLIFAGVAYTSPGLIQGWVSRAHPVPVKEDVIIFDEFSGGSGKDSSANGSAKVLGESTSGVSSPTPKQQYYQPPELQPTATPTQEVVVQQAQEYKTPWDGYANKEAFCRDIADRVMKEPLPEIDQSNLPPELRLTPNLDAMWRDAFQGCMSQIRDY